jgi:hypothetical protein
MTAMTMTVIPRRRIGPYLPAYYSSRKDRPTT